jgi:outer membrane protein OmpA-like peptidoglycan-associated protein
MIKGIKENYSGDFVKLPAAELTSANLRKDVLLTPTSSGPSIGAGTVIVLENIYYDFNKSSIRTGAARELEELVMMMQTYPSMIIELSSHTDSRGGNDYNLTLSKARAESAKQFLRSKGIDSARVRAIGYGESQPRNKCVDGVKCSEEEHQFNRRTEVKVTSIDSPVNIRYGNNAPEKIDRKN